MISRRKVLTGTAAASIAAIASAHGVPTASAAAQDGLGLGFGDLNGGAVGAFSKAFDTLSFIVKWDIDGAEIFFKTLPEGNIGIFVKTFAKGWTKIASQFEKFHSSLDGSNAGFTNLQSDGAEFFVKMSQGIRIVGTVTNNADGVDVTLRRADQD